MILSTKMKQLSAIVLETDSDRVTAELLRLGVMHFVQVTEFESGLQQKISHHNPKIQQTKLVETRKRIESLLKQVKIFPKLDEKYDLMHPQEINLDKTNQAIEEVIKTTNALRERQSSIHKEILKLQDIHRQLSMYGDINLSVKSKSKYSFLEIQVGVIPSKRFNGFSQELKDLPCVVLPFHEDEDFTNIMLISMKRDSKQIDRILDKYGWSEIEFTHELGKNKDAAINKVNKKIERYEKQQESIKKELNEMLMQHSNHMLKEWQNIRIHELLGRIQTYFSKTSKTMIFSGWIPADKIDHVINSIKEVTRNHAFIETHLAKTFSDREMQIPVQPKNPKIFAPFQMLVYNYSIPKYGTIDPTPFVGISYLMMFGLMFGDFGHGLVLFVLGLLGTLLIQEEGSSYKKLAQLIQWCGASAMVFGILFGSYFGMALIPPLWFDYHGIVTGHAHSSGFVTNIYGILGLTIYFGIGVISFGLIFNWINRLLKKDYINLFFDKGGLLGGLIYGAGIYTAFYFTQYNYKALPDPNLLFFLIGIPTLLLFMKGPLEYLHHKKHGNAHPFTVMTIFDFLMEWIVEVLEVFSGFLANTLSFMRVAGLGIAHVSLMVAFFEIARMVSGEGNLNLWAYLILIIGNLLVIALEGLSAGIQSLRLNYYEFFSKFFNEKGEAYSPISLKNKD